jgi:hypothetical protein
MTDGTGTTNYTYVPVGIPGALQLQQESSPLTSSAITSTYDALGRLSMRAVAGSGAEAFGYDAIGRLTTHASDLGSFTLSYLGQTGQITGRALSSSTLATSWSYLTNANDRRLSGIANVGLTAGQFSTFGYAHVLFVSGDPRHVKAMEKLATSQFEGDERGKIHFVSPEEGLALLDGWTGTAIATTVRGYKVKTTTAVIDSEEAGRRRSAVASVIARSLQAKKD